MRITLVALLAIAALRADTVTSQVIVNDPTLFISTFPQFQADVLLDLPGFDSSLGLLDSISVNWEVSILALEHYQTAFLDGSQILLTYSQTATASLGDSSVTQTLFGSTTVPGTICHPCGVAFGFDLNGSASVTDPDLLAFSQQGGMLPMEASTLVVAGPDTGDFNTAYLTDGFLLPGSAINYTAEAAYSYTPASSALGGRLGGVISVVTPEPGMGWMIGLVVLAGTAWRKGKRAV